jgi:hypothetical protein
MTARREGSTNPHQYRWMLAVTAPSYVRRPSYIYSLHPNRSCVVTPTSIIPHLRYGCAAKVNLTRVVERSTATFCGHRHCKRTFSG